MNRIALSIVALLLAAAGGCTSAPYADVDPKKPAEGMGYVDFHVVDQPAGFASNRGHGIHSQLVIARLSDARPVAESPMIRTDELRNGFATMDLPMVHRVALPAGTYRFGAIVVRRCAPADSTSPHSRLQCIAASSLPPDAVANKRAEPLVGGNANLRFAADPGEDWSLGFRRDAELAEFTVAVAPGMVTPVELTLLADPNLAVSAEYVAERAVTREAAIGTANFRYEMEPRTWYGPAYVVGASVKPAVPYQRKRQMPYYPVAK